MMKLNFSGILEYIFPSSEDELALSPCTKEMFSRKLCASKDGGILALASFADPHIRAAIHLNKFHFHPHARILLGALLTEYLLQLQDKPYLIIPVPLSSLRYKKRGYNQVTVVINEALSGTNASMRENILYRERHTPPQTSLSKKDRSKNMRGAFAVAMRHKAALAGAHVLLIDDVTTTGATLSEAKAALLPHDPASVTCIALAH